MAKREPPGEDAAPGPARLPRGRHGLPRELIAENQRQRLIAGIIEAVAANGYGATTIAHITAAAKLSRRTFYENFSSKEECFAAAHEAIFAHLRETMRAAGEPQTEWPQRVREQLGALLGVLGAQPEMARFFLMAPAGAGDRIAERHHCAMRELVAVLLEGALALEGPGEPATTSEQALAGGISRLIVRKLNGGEGEQLAQLRPALVELVLRPFIGSEKAAQVAGEGD